MPAEHDFVASLNKTRDDIRKVMDSKLPFTVVLVYATKEGPMCHAAIALSDEVSTLHKSQMTSVLLENAISLCASLQKIYEDKGSDNAEKIYQQHTGSLLLHPYVMRMIKDTFGLDMLSAPADIPDRDRSITILRNEKIVGSLDDVPPGTFADPKETHGL